MKKRLKKTALISVALIIAAAVLLVYSGSRDKLIPADAAVILGNEVYADGRPSPRLAGRLDTGLKLYQRGAVKIIIVSGGVGKSGVDEATAMAAYLRAKGVPDTAIVVDSSGLNTWQTAEFTAAYLRKNSMKGVIAVSQAFHIPRTVMALTAAGCPDVGQAAADYWELRDVYAALREVPAYLVYWWKYR